MLSNRFVRIVTLTVIAALVLALAPSMPDKVQAAGGVLAYGDVVNGQISNANYYEMWQFEGSKGDHIGILMEGDGQLDPYIGLIEGSSEQVLAEDDDSGGNSNAYLEVTLPSSGAFIIVATRYNLDEGTSTGDYTLSLEGSGTGSQNTTNTSSGSTTGPQELEPGVWYMGDAVLDETIYGEIANDSYAQLYGVQLEAGTEFIAAMFADGSNLDAYLIFLSEDGDVLAEDDDTGAEIEGAGKSDALIALTVKQAGLYFLVATRSGVDAGRSSGAYALYATIPQDEPAPEPAENDLPPGVVNMGAIEIGQQAEAAISDDAYFHFYLLEGQAGQQVTITMRGSGGLDAYLGVLDTNDEVLAEDDDSAGGSDAQISMRLPESGTYLIVATRNGLDAGTTTGNYTLEVTDGTPPAPSGQTGIGGFGGLPGRAIESEGQTLYLRGNGASDDPAKNTPIEQFESDNTLPGRDDFLGTRGRLGNIK